MKLSKRRERRSALRVISTLYGPSVNLAHYLGAHLSGEDALLAECGNNAALKRLLKTYLVCPCDGIQPEKCRPRSFDRSYSSQYEVVSDVIKILCQSRPVGSHLLSLGFRQSSRPGCSSVTGAAGLENNFPNTIADRLKTVVWQDLLVLIGDELMMKVLLNCVIFEPLSDGCFLQLCGRPAYQVWKAKKEAGLTKVIVPCNASMLAAQDSSFEGNKLVQSSGETFHNASGMHCNVSTSTRSSSRASSQLATSSGGMSNASSGSTSAPFSPPLCSTADQGQGDDPTVPVASQASRSSNGSDVQISWYEMAEASKNSRTFQRSKAFFVQGRREGLAVSHVLEKLGPSGRGSAALLRHVFLGSASKTKRPRLPGRLCHLQPTFAKLITRYKKIRLKFLLDRCCPLPQNLEGRLTATQKGELPSHCELISSFTPHRQVVTFVRTFLKRLVPFELWGSGDNYNMFCEHLDVFVRMNRHDTFGLQQLLHGIKVSHCKWLPSPRGSKHVPLQLARCRQELFEKWLWWLMDGVVIELLKGCFYCTDSTSYRNRMFYYRKCVWQCLQDQAVSALDGKLLEAVSPAEAQKALASRLSLGISTLRLLPKSGPDLRPIVNLGYKPAAGYLKNIFGEKGAAMFGFGLKPVNFQLRSLLGVLQMEEDESPDLAGSSVPSMDVVHHRWRDFVKKRKLANDTRPLYFVAVDIKGCFDNIDQDLLMEIVQGVFADTDYMLRKFVATYVGAESNIELSFRKRACSLGDFQQFSAFLDNYMSTRSLRNALVCDQVVYPRLNEHDMLKQLKAHIQNNFIRIGQRLFRQRRGIPQGSVLSSILCSLYYAHLEKTLLDRANATDGLLLRFVDDYLLVTPVFDEAIHLLSYMYQDPDSGFMVNFSKTMVNFDLSLPGFDEQFPTPESDLFPWCGILFDTTTLEASIDYSRWFGTFMSNLLTVNGASHPFIAAKKSLAMTLKTKFIALVVDGSINSLLSIKRSTYRAFAFTAIKFHSLTKHLPDGKSVRCNVQLFEELLCTLVQKVCASVQRSLRVRNNSSPGDADSLPEKETEKTTFPLSNGEVYRLALCAFWYVIRRHQSAYSKEFVSSVRGKVARLSLDVPVDWQSDLDQILP